MKDETLSLQKSLRKQWPWPRPW